MKKIVTVAFAFILAGPAVGQITLDESTLQNLIGKRLINVDHEPGDTTGAAAIAAQTGTGETWDITGFNWMIVDTFYLDFLGSVSGTIGENDPDFANSNLVQLVTAASDTFDFAGATYSSFDANGLNQIGSLFIGDFDSDMNPDTSKSLYTPAEIDIIFPFTFGTVISDSVMHENFVSDTLVFSEQVAKDGQVDGWGTLITPDGSFDVLRYRYEERTHSGGFTFETENIEWWTENGPIFNISISEFGPGFSSFFMNYSRVTVTDPSSIEPGTAPVPETFVLQQNYPNPFNPSTTIPFELKESGLVKLTIYDILGRQVDVLLERDMPVGVHEVAWNPGELTGGVYVATVEVDGRKQSRTMTLLK